MSKKKYQKVIDNILSKLKKGEIPWKQPWLSGGMPKNFFYKRRYHGINTLTLAMEAEDQGYISPYWLTFNQAKKLDGHVKKGETGSNVIFTKWINPQKNQKENKDKKDTQKNDENNNCRIPIFKVYTVFNIEQTSIEVPEKKQLLDFKPIKKCEDIIKKNNPTIKHIKQKAFYRVSEDFINLPQKNTFKSIEEYYSTLFHELVHWSGHNTRLNRKGVSKMNGFGSERYSKEELIAEIGCGIVCSEIGIENSTIDNSVAYINNWLDYLEGSDDRMIIWASGHATKAVDFILEKEENLKTNKK